ncbi:MAG: flagellar type III secretion system pore protein FliP [Planctomycetaceae bacterium]|jgi:flagellar biosynthetic protein FliP|nr:flagellar type III secretion system pore protein FliP [Planctomycetaceae bacterium]
MLNNSHSTFHLSPPDYQSESILLRNRVNKIHNTNNTTTPQFLYKKNRSRVRRIIVTIIILICATIIMPFYGGVVSAQVMLNNYQPNKPKGRYADRREPHFMQFEPSIYDSNNASVDRSGREPFETVAPKLEPPIDEPRYEEGSMALPIPKEILPGADFLRSPGGLVSTIQIMVILTVITLAPSIMIMTTSFVRIMTVLAILRQAIGTNQLPPSQVITALSLFLTLLVMMPVWSEIYSESVLPFSERRIGLERAYNKAERPVRKFMAEQIMRCHNTDDVKVFLRYIDNYTAPDEMTWKDIPWRALLPAFMLSELKTAFMIGFQIYLPFLVLDMVIASVMVSMGMMMLPPVIISLPFKLMLFVLMDGWRLVVVMLLESFEHYVPETTREAVLLQAAQLSGFC